MSTASLPPIVCCEILVLVSTPPLKTEPENFPMPKFHVLLTDYAWPDLDIERKILSEIDAELVVAEKGEHRSRFAGGTGEEQGRRCHHDELGRGPRIGHRRGSQVPHCPPRWALGWRTSMRRAVPSHTSR